jgi:hypothetical protein
MIRFSSRSSWSPCASWLFFVIVATTTAYAQGARATLTGKVLSPTGAPQGNVTLVITTPAGIDRLATSDPDGTFVIGGLAPGRYRLRVDDETFAPWSNDAVELAAGERKTIQIALQARIVAQTRATISGTVIGPDGRPRADVLIILTNPAGIDRRATSEPSGAYVFGGLLPGAYRLRVEETGAQPLAIDGLALVAGERRLVDLRLQPVPIPPTVPGPPGPGPKPGPGPRPPDEKASVKRVKPGLPPEVTADDGSFEAKPDRWHFPWPAYERYSPPEKMPWVRSGGPFDPYNQNTAKGDFPIGKGDLFANLNLQFNNNINPRQVEAGAPQSQFFYNQNLVGGLEIFKGDTVFQPKSWAVRATAVLNLNSLSTLTPSIGTKYGLEEAFAEKRLSVISPAFDFVSIRGGMQNFNSDFRGYVFQDNQLGVRLFGNARSNRDQYNVAYFSMRGRDPASQLHDFSNRNQDVIIANYYIQDFGAPGYTGMFNVHVNRDRGGLGETGAEQVVYVGFHGDGHWGTWSVSHAFYQAFGTDDDSRIERALHPALVTAPVNISAQMAALELSKDADWKRFRLSAFYASGDDGSDPTKAKGFDSITDNPNLAGGQFMFWTQQKTAVTGLPGAILSEKFSLLPNMRSKFVDRSNFVNPGLILLNGGVDLRVSPQIKVVTNASYLRFADATILRTLTAKTNASAFSDNVIGLDLSTGAKIRPFTNENFFLLAGFSMLRPQGGFANAVSGTTTQLYSVFAAFQVAY